MQLQTFHSTALPGPEQRRDQSEPVPCAIPIRDATTRLVMLSEVLRHLSGVDASNLAAYSDEAVTAELLDRLRKLTLVDTFLHCSSSFGLSIKVEARQVAEQLRRDEHMSGDRAVFESLVRAGASPRLMCRLFGVSDLEVRRLRKLLAPTVIAGGRPRMPEPEDRARIHQAWAASSSLPERQRWASLSAAFPAYTVAALESAVNAPD